MKRFNVLMGIICMAFIVSILGCSQKAVTTANDAIKAAAAMPTVKEKVDYLISKANALYSSKEYQQVSDIANHILTIDPNSQAAKDLLAKAKNALSQAAQKAVTDVKKDLGV